MTTIELKLELKAMEEFVFSDVHKKVEYQVLAKNGGVC